MKTLLLLFILLPTAEANTQYYNQYGTYQGSSIRQGNQTSYYDQNGYYLGNQTETGLQYPTPYIAPQPQPRIPIPGVYESSPSREMFDVIGDPE